ncbi:MAG: polysaccharide pyruvyl transferase family protein, partial [candidate division WOR-3 bacterium]
CYAVLRFLHIPPGFLLAFPPLRSIVEASAVLDVSGISYVDGREPMLVYNIACNIPALLVGIPLIKLSQALGPFRRPVNNLAARFILRRIDTIFARGSETHEFLRQLGLTNISPAADLAFILNEHQPIPPPPIDRYPGLAGKELIVGVSPSEVLARLYSRRDKDLVAVLTEVLDTLHERTGAHIVIMAHSMLGPESRSRNNDYHICRKLYENMRHRSHATLIVDDLSASELRSLISLCRCFIACRFHSMISSLCAGVPPIVLAWSHKYHEVMNDFGLDTFVFDIARTDPGELLARSTEIISDPEPLKGSIGSALPNVIASAESQIEYTAGIVCRTKTRSRAGATARKLYREYYMGRFGGTFLGYSANAGVRDDAASGGLVSALIINRLRAGAITGAIAARAVLENGTLVFESDVCTDEQSVLDCRTSIYSDFNHARAVIRLLQERDGTFAVVALPCQWRMINSYLEKHPDLKRKLGLGIGLWCGHATDRRLIEDFLRIRGIDTGSVERLYYRKGHWRGETVIEYEDGRIETIPFKTGYGLLQNLYVDCKLRCFCCTDHFAVGSDVSFGDAWLRELKASPVKHSMAITFSDRGAEAIAGLAGECDAFIQEIDPTLAVDAQKRAVIWHTY